MADLSPETLRLIVGVIFALSIAGGVYFAINPFLSGERQAEKRLAGVTENKATRTARRAKDEEVNSRRKQVADTLRDLEERQKVKEKVSLRLRLQRAGLQFTPQQFWIGSGVLGVLVGVGLFVAMPSLHPLACAGAAFVGAFGLPRYILKFLTKRRQNKFTSEFANAIDVIVRGVKSGLPLNECLNIIARESPSPIREEFQDLVEQQRVGVPLAECFERMMVRVPLPEVKFFSIVIAIQQQAGGNLSEALGNLSGVLRDRKKLQMKVKALSAEAKASAYVLGALPFIVMTLVYLTSPAYIMILFTAKLGKVILIAAGMWMLIGLLVMRKMINFKY